MAENVNQHYDKLIKQTGSKKDSIFEPCRVTEFDTKTLMAKTYGIRSKAVKENVIVLFPSMYLNSGIISFPVKDSVGLTFAGVDNETYMLPAQFFPPVKETQNASVKSNSSPAQFDELLNLEHLEQGEHLVRALSGAQVYVRNTGEVELSTSKLHRVSLSELDGALETIVERVREHVGYSEYFSGVYDPKFSDDSTEHHIYAKYFEEVPDWETDEVVSRELVRKLMEAEVPNESVFPLPKKLPIARMQMVNVFEENSDEKKRSDVDDEHLYYDFDLFRKIKEVLYKRYRIQLSKEGALHTTAINEEERKRVDIIQSKEMFEAKLEHDAIQVESYSRVDKDEVKSYYEKAAVNSSFTGNADSAIMEYNSPSFNASVTANSAGVLLESSGGARVQVTAGNEVVVTDSTGTYTLSSLRKRLDRLESLH